MIIKNIRFVVLSVCIPACLAGLTACESYPHDKATAIVTAQYPGKKQPSKCRPYADALFKALKSNHIEAWKVSFLGGSGTEPYIHSMVVYRDAGSYWYADNIFPYPVKTWGTTPLEWAEDRGNVETASGGAANIFSPPASYCTVLKVDTEIPTRRVPRKWGSLYAKR